MENCVSCGKQGNDLNRRVRNWELEKNGKYKVFVGVFT